MINKSLEFHVQNDDYFGTLATVLSLLGQDINKNGFSKKHLELLDGKVDELMHLQRNYKIEKN